jgi:hypothetical protein
MGANTPTRGTGGAGAAGAGGSSGDAGTSGGGSAGVSQVGTGGSAGRSSEPTDGGASGTSSGNRPDAGSDVDGSGGDGVDAGAGGATDSGADSGSVPPVCDPTKSPSVAACVIDEKYGVFVSPNGSDLSGDGTRTRPVATLAKGAAMAHAAAKRVFACATQGSFKESLTIDAKLDGVALYGGFNCASWAYSSSAPALVASPTSVALKVQGLVAGLVIEDFSMQAAAGSSAGESSIAALITQSQKVTLKRVTLKAGTGAAGADGTGVVTPALEGTSGFDSQFSCSGLGTYGLLGYEMRCAGAPPSGGGAPGDGDSSAAGGPPAGPGGNGTPISIGGGAGGSQETAAHRCRDGIAGTPGTSQPPGKGASGGTLTVTGYQPGGGASGLSGTVGQGGGGGGGRIADASCINGASGGGGGTGGCPGQGGTGGKGGGASIALATVNSSVVLEGCVLVATAGGAGGRGGPGQTGGNGGIGGLRTLNSKSSTDKTCAGGDGGKGGDGGHGGGGGGGPSIGIATVGTPPSQTTTAIQIASVAAPGGADGGGVKTGVGAGAAGLVASSHAF